MRRTFPIKPKHVYVSGMYGLGTIRFLAVVKHGNGTREVAVDVDPELILKLAKALEATRGHACSTKYARIADVYSDDQLNVGHAVWHVQNPDRPMPCVDHSTVIDMEALPTGDMIDVGEDAVRDENPTTADGER